LDGFKSPPGPPRPRKRPIFSQIQNPPLLNPPLAAADPTFLFSERASLLNIDTLSSMRNGNYMQSRSMHVEYVHRRTVPATTKFSDR